MRTYSELRELSTFEDRFRYLQLRGEVGAMTFGSDRYINQIFYQSDEWRRARQEVIMRDMGCDLGIEDRLIQGAFLIHHMNPIREDQIIHRDPDIFNPEFLITTTHRTHNAIHYGDDSILRGSVIVERRPNDTCPWR